MVAQGVESVEFLVDNDHFNFWDDLFSRPDRDYTHGTKLALEWGARDAPGPVYRVELGQLIFNPSVPLFFPSFYRAPNRPFAGWLYLSARRVRVAGRRRSVLGGYFGVTGPASLGQAAQRGFHELVDRRWNPDWEPELPQELGFGATGGTGWLVPLVDGTRVTVSTGFDLMGEVGTVRTEGSAILLLEAQLAFGPVGLLARASSRQRLRLHDLFIEGSLLSGESFASLEPLLREDGLDLGIRLGPALLRYQVTRRGREFDGQFAPHTYSGFSLALGAGTASWLPDHLRTWKP